MILILLCDKQRISISLSIFVQPLHCTKLTHQAIANYFPNQPIIDRSQKKLTHFMKYGTVDVLRRIDQTKNQVCSICINVFSQLSCIWDTGRTNLQRQAEQTQVYIYKPAFISNIIHLYWYLYISLLSFYYCRNLDQRNL